LQTSLIKVVFPIPIGPKIKKANSADGTKIAEAMRGLKIDSPFGSDGTITMRAEDQTVIGYAIGWGTTISKEPYVPKVTTASWASILELEGEWKKRNKYI
jgi:branched-chain amino acid transport system substrate-binding protein